LTSPTRGSESSSLGTHEVAERREAALRTRSKGARLLQDPDRATGQARCSHQHYAECAESRPVTTLTSRRTTADLVPILTTTYFRRVHSLLPRLTGRDESSIRQGCEHG
jgi:hypothetical protein